jgi:hypothetical protein
MCVITDTRAYYRIEVLFIEWEKCVSSLHICLDGWYPLFPTTAKKKKTFLLLLVSLSLPLCYINRERCVYNTLAIVEKSQPIPVLSTVYLFWYVWSNIATMQGKLIIYLILTLAMATIWCKAASIGEDSDELHVRNQGGENLETLLQTSFKKRTAHSFSTKSHCSTMSLWNLRREIK